jgi:hypothetical protein
MPTIRICKLSLGIAVVLFLSGCKAEIDQNAWSSQQEVVDQFYSKPVKERVATFEEYSFDQRYAIYLYGNQVQHPPALYLTDTFAAGGQEIVAPLSARLAASEYEVTTRDLVMVFAAMHRLKTYDVAKDEALMRQLTEATARMRETDWKKIVARELATIRSGDSQETQ